MTKTQGISTTSKAGKYQPSVAGTYTSNGKLIAKPVTTRKSISLLDILLGRK